MAVKMVVFWFSLVLFIVGSQAAGEFDVIHTPRSLKFSGSSRTYESLLKEIFSASLGLSVEEDAEWDGLSIDDPFATPEAVVEVYVDGVSSLDIVVPKAHAYPLYVDQYEPDTFEAIQHRIQQRFGMGENKLVKFRLSDPSDVHAYSKIFGDITPQEVNKGELQHLLTTVEEDNQFLNELGVLNAITSRVQSGVIVPDNIIDFYNFRFQSLHPLSDFHGPNSFQVKEAKRLLGQAIVELSNAFVKAYHGSALVAAVATDVAHTRRVRAAPDNGTYRDLRQADTGPDPSASPDDGLPTPPDAGDTNNTGDAPTTGDDDLGGSDGPWTPPTTPPRPAPTSKPPRAPEPTDKPSPSVSNDNAFSDDYAAIFNILLWFGLAYVFALVAIVHALANMDPGRDSIIYRMTNPRMKKDN